MNIEITTNTYLIGVLSAITAGIIFNIGIVIQKIAVSKISTSAKLLNQLIRKPLWLIGFSFQFIIGTPLNMYAQSNIGPAIIPGLMSIGLIVLTIGAVRYAGEAFNFSDFAGILLVIFAVTVFGLSKLSINMEEINLRDTILLIRLAVFTIIIVGFSVLCHIFQKSNTKMKGILRTINAGLFLSLSNLWLGIFMVFFSKWSNGNFLLSDLILAGISCAIVFAGSMLGIAETQRAFQFGEASKLIPIQFVPVQILPIIAYFLVFNLKPATPYSTLLAISGIGLVLIGAALLARRQYA